MRMIKYVLVFILVIVLGAVAFVPWMGGNEFRKNYLAAINKINQEGTYHLDIQSYRLGWLGSNVKLHLTRTDTLRKGVGFTIDQHISHGPYLHDAVDGWIFLGAEIKSHITMDPEFVTLLSLKTPPEMNVTTKIATDKTTASRFDISALEMVTHSQTLSVQGVDGTFSYGMNQPLVLDYDAKGISLQTAKGEKAELNELTSHNEITCQNGHCAPAISFSIPALLVQAQNKSVTISGLQLGYVSTVADEKLTGKLKVAISKITAPEGSVGPLAFDVGVNNLDFVKVRKIMGDYATAKAGVAGQDVPTMPILLSIVTKEVNELVSSDITLMEDMQLTTPDGNVNLTGKVWWPPEAALPANMKDIMQNVSASLDVHVASSLMDQVLQQLAVRVDAKNAEKKAAAGPQTAQPSTLDQDITDFKNQLDLFVTQKVMVPEGVKLMTDTLATGISIHAFNVHMSQAVVYQKITPQAATTLATLYAKIARDRLVEFQTLFNETPITDMESLNNLELALAQKNLLNQGMANNLIKLQSQDLGTTSYTGLLDGLVNGGGLERPQADLLIKAYAKIHGDDDTSDSSTTAKGPLSTLDQLKASLDKYGQQGYFTQDDSGYSTTLTYDHGGVKVNGKTFVWLLDKANPKSAAPAQPTAGAPAVTGVAVQQPASVPPTSATMPQQGMPVAPGALPPQPVTPSKPVATPPPAAIPGTSSTTLPGTQPASIPVTTPGTVPPAPIKSATPPPALPTTQQPMNPGAPMSAPSH